MVCVNHSEKLRQKAQKWNIRKNSVLKFDFHSLIPSLLLRNLGRNTAPDQGECKSFLKAFWKQR